MIYITERHVEDYLHVLANVNTIRIFRNAFPDEQICFISAHAHNLKVKAFLQQDEQIDFKEFDNRQKTKNPVLRALSLLKRGVDDLFFFSRLFKKSSADDLLVISHIYPHSLITFNLLKRFYPRRIVLILLHGEVEYTLFAQSTAQKLIAAMYKLSFRLTPDNLNYVFLTKVSANIVAMAQLAPGKHPIFIELPTITAEETILPIVHTMVQPVKIGHIGSAGKRKNVNLLYDLADKIQLAINNGQVQLSVIGVLEDSIKPFLNAGVINYVDSQIDKPLSRDIYDQKIAELDFAIFFYGPKDFLLRSSAAFFDAVLYVKPVIALENQFFTELFKEYGEMGYLCADNNEMKKLIDTLISDPEQAQAQIKIFKKNINAYKATLSIANIAADLKNQTSGLLPAAFTTTDNTNLR